MADIILDGIGALNLGDLQAQPVAATSVYWADGIPSLGMPTRPGVTDDLELADSLENGSVSDLRKAAGLRQSVKDQYDPLTTLGLTDSLVPPVAKRMLVPDGSDQTNAGVSEALANYTTEQLANLPNGSATKLTPDLTVVNDLAVAFAMQSDLAPQSMNPITEERIKALDQEFYTFTGSDLRVTVQVAGGRGGYKQLVELSTITVSIHREKTPVRACGYINPKAFAYGRRTIAGTIILTQFWIDSLLRFLPTSGMTNEDGYLAPNPIPDASARDLSYSKIDQLPPLNFTFYFCDEYGHASTRKLLGVTLVTDGTVYSVNDQLTEQTISFMALDFTPLQPMDITGTLRDFAKNIKTPRDVHAEGWWNRTDNRRLPNVALSIPKPVFQTSSRPKPLSAGAQLLPSWAQNILRKVG